MRGTLSHNTGRMYTHLQHRRMEAAPRSRAGQATHPIPVPRVPMTRWQAARRRAAALIVMSAAVFVAGCASGPRSLDIDRSIQAVSHSSRVSSVVILYTAADTPRSIYILVICNDSSHYQIYAENHHRDY